MGFRCLDKYRLELHWSSCRLVSADTAVLSKAYFTGPVLADAQPIGAPDFIDLDLTPQHLVVLGGYYIVRLSWAGVTYADDRIFLEGARLTNECLETVHRLGDRDYMVINTEKHEAEKHPYNLVYPAQTMRGDRAPYVFGV